MNVSGLVSKKINCVLSRVSLFQPCSCCESIKLQTFELSDRCTELNRPNHFQNIRQMLCINPWHLYICISSGFYMRFGVDAELWKFPCAFTFDFLLLFCTAANIHLLTYFVLIWSRNYRCPLVELTWNEDISFLFSFFDITEWHSFYRISMCNEYYWPKNEANLLKLRINSLK